MLVQEGVRSGDHLVCSLTDTSLKTYLSQACQVQKYARYVSSALSAGHAFFEIEEQACSPVLSLLINARLLCRAYAFGLHRKSEH